MVNHWTTSDVVLAIGWPCGPSKSAGLQAGLRTAIREGRIPGGVRLPSTREFAASLEIARGTVVEAYAQLVAEGYLRSARGSGTRVADHVHAEATPVAPTPQSARAATGARYDLRAGVPDLSLFPGSDWAWALGEAARSIGPSDLGYGDPLGNWVLREALSAYLVRVRGAHATSANLLVGIGYQQCLAIVARSLSAAGVRKVAVEDPGDRTADKVLANAGLSVVHVPVDDQGLIVEALRQSDAQAMICTPSHQVPTGAVLGPRRRAALTEWANDQGGWVVEDDYDSEFRYDQQPVGALQGLLPERTILIGSTSKTHAPSIRLGWALLPHPLRRHAAAQKAIEDRETSSLLQLAFARLLETGRHDRHIRRMRRIYAVRRKLVATTLNREAGWELQGLQAGFHGLLLLPRDVDEDQVLRRANDHSIALTGLGTYTASRGQRHGLVVGYGNAGEGSLREGIHTMIDLIKTTRHVARP